MAAVVMQDLHQHTGHKVVGRAHYLTHADRLRESHVAEKLLDVAILDVQLNTKASFPAARRHVDARSR